MVRKEHLKYLKKFKKKLSLDVPLDKVFLFGSRARGTPHRWSDFDLLVVSKTFERKPSFKRAVGFHRYWTIDYPVDFLCCTPKEFERLRNKISIVREAVEEGIEI